MKNYSHKDITEKVKSGILASAILDEIKSVHEPVINFILSENYNDRFNVIRLLMPIIETASKIECGGDCQLILEKLGVPRPDITWRMFRHGLTHYLRPFFVIHKGQRINWAIALYPCNHIDLNESIVICGPKLLDDVKKYLEKFKADNKEIEIQTGLELIEK